MNITYVIVLLVGVGQDFDVVTKGDVLYGI
jgi:hypothetical protein